MSREPVRHKDAGQRRFPCIDRGHEVGRSRLGNPTSRAAFSLLDPLSQRHPSVQTATRPPLALREPPEASLRRLSHPLRTIRRLESATGRRPAMADRAVRKTGRSETATSHRSATTALRGRLGTRLMRSATSPTVFTRTTSRGTTGGRRSTSPTAPPGHISGPTVTTQPGTISTTCRTAKRCGTPPTIGGSDTHPVAALCAIVLVPQAKELRASGIEP